MGCKMRGACLDSNSPLKTDFSMVLLPLFLLPLIQPSLSACPASSPLYPATFNGQPLSFTTCQDLNRGAVFYWNYSNGVLTTLYENAPAVPYGWVGWGNSLQGKMWPSSVVVAFGDPANPGGFTPNVSAWNLPSFDPSSFIVVSPAEANFTVAPTVEVRGNGTVMALFSAMGYDLPQINLISASGPGFNFSTGVLERHLQKPQIMGLDLTSGTSIPVRPISDSPKAAHGSMQRLGLTPSILVLGVVLSIFEFHLRWL